MILKKWNITINNFLKFLKDSNMNFKAICPQKLNLFTSYEDSIIK
jgi:hypothetical protein